MSGLSPLENPQLRMLLYRYVPNFADLERASWFFTNKDLQHKLLKVVNLRLGRKVVAWLRDVDFEFHLDLLIDEYSHKFSDMKLPVNNQDVLKLFRRNVPDFWYLEERGWFMRNSLLQVKLLKCVCFGLTDHLFVVIGDFDETLDKLLQNYSPR